MSSDSTPTTSSKDQGATSRRSRSTKPTQPTKTPTSATAPRARSAAKKPATPTAASKKSDKSLVRQSSSRSDNQGNQRASKPAKSEKKANSRQSTRQPASAKSGGKSNASADPTSPSHERTQQQSLRSNDSAPSSKAKKPVPLAVVTVSEIKAEPAASKAAVATRARMAGRRQKATVPKFTAEEEEEQHKPVQPSFSVPSGSKPSYSSSTTNGARQQGSSKGKASTKIPSADDADVPTSKPSPIKKIITKPNGVASDIDDEVGKRLKIKLSVSHLQFEVGHDKLILNALSNLHELKDPTHWVLLEVNDNGNLSYSCSGDGKDEEAIDQIKPLLQEDQVQVVFIALPDPNTPLSEKVAMIVWLGENAKAILKARSGPQRVELKQFASKALTVSAELVVTEKNDLTVRAIWAQLRGLKGAVSTGAAVVDLEEEAQRAVDADHIKKQREEEERKNKERFALVGETQVHIKFSGTEQVAEALNKIKDTESSEDFVVIGMEGPELHSLNVIEIGTGGLSKEWCAKYLQVDELFVFVLKITTSDTGYGKFAKYMFIQWLGSRVKSLLLAKARQLYSALLHLVGENLHITGDMEAQDPGDVTMDSILLKLSGSRVRGQDMEYKKKSEKFKDFGRTRSELHYDDKKEIEACIRTICRFPLGVQGQIDSKFYPHSTSWILLTYANNQPDLLITAARGFSVEWFEEGKFEASEVRVSEPAYKKYLKPDNICFILERFLVVPSQFELSNEKDKIGYAKPCFGLIQWEGEESGIMETAISSYHWNEFSQMVAAIAQSEDTALKVGHCRMSSLDEVQAHLIRKALKIE